MRRSELRSKFDCAVDDIDEIVSNILVDLEGVEDKATWDAVALSEDEIGEIQTAVIDAIKALRELKEGLF
jgi:hypothetical protein